VCDFFLLIFSGDKKLDFNDDELISETFFDFNKSLEKNDPDEQSFKAKSVIENHNVTLDSIYIISSKSDMLCFEKNFKIASEFFTANGGSFYLDNKLIKFINTCTLDYYLLIWVILSKTNIFLKNIFHSINPTDFYKNINKITQSIGAKKWNSARLFWSKFISKKYSETQEAIIYDYYGSEMDGFSSFHSIQSFKYSYKCSEINCRFGNSWNEEEFSGFSMV
jgi:hypothetical protein